MEFLYLWVEDTIIQSLPRFSFMGGVGKRIITKTWMSEIFLQGGVLRVGGDALIMQLGRQFIMSLSLKFDELSFFLGN